MDPGSSTQVEETLRALDDISLGVMRCGVSRTNGTHTSIVSHQPNPGLPCQACYQKSSYWLTLIGRLSARSFECQHLLRTDIKSKLRQLVRDQENMRQVLLILQARSTAFIARRAIQHL